MNEVDDQRHVKFYNHKQVILLRFSKLIKMSGKNNWTLLRARSNSSRCESDTEHQTGEQYSGQCKIKWFEYCIIIAKGLLTFANKNKIK